MRVAVICEGLTDFVVLGAVVSTRGDVERLTLLQPLKDKLIGPGPGWQGVRKFLQTAGTALDIGVHDLVIVHIDADVRKSPELHDLLAESDTESLEPLCDVVKSWFSDHVSPNAIIVLPREATEAWLVAAHTNIKHPEMIEDPATTLAARGLIPLEDGRPLKRRDDYARLCGALERLIHRRATDRLPELERFLEKLYA